MTGRRLIKAGRLRAIIAFALALAVGLSLSPVAFAACASPAGNEGDIGYSSSQHVMVYCNGTSWISMGVSSPVSFGTLTTGDLCTATSGTAITCTTAQINLASQVTGTLGVTNGGTGLSALTSGSILYASAANILSQLAIGTTGQVLTVGSSGVPVWAASTGGVTSFSAGTTGLTPSSATTGAIVLAGTLGVPNGGTGLAALTSNVIYKGNGTGNLAASSLTDTGTIVYTTENLGVGTSASTGVTQPLTIYGNVDTSSGSGYLTEITNSTATVAHLAKLNTSGAAVIGSTTDTDGMVGIVVGTTAAGNAQVAVNGQASCTFENATTAGDFVTIGTGTAGDCRDAGTSRSTTAQTIGRVLSSVSLGSTAPVALALNGAGGGAASGSTGYVQFNNGGAFLGTSNLFWNNTAGALGIGTASPNASAILDLTSTTQGLLPPRVTASQMNAISSPAAGLTVYNSTLGAIDVYNGTTWMAGGGGGQLIGVYSCSTAGSYNVTFTNTTMPTSTGTCGNINLPSNTSYIVVETWGGGGGGGGGGDAGNNGGSGGGTGGNTTFTYASTTISATGGGAGSVGSAGNAPGGSGGGGTNGDINLSGSDGMAVLEPVANAGSYATNGGSAPLGGGGGLEANAGKTCGGGGGGGYGYYNGTAGGAGGGGGGGGYAAKFIANASGTYTYSVGSGGTGGTKNGGYSANGGAGGTGCIKISVYTTGVTNGSIGSGTANGLAYYSSTGTGISSIASTANAILATNASGVPAFTTAETVYGTNVGIGTVTPSQPLTIYGNVDASSGSGYLTEITNSTATVAHLAKLNTSGAAVIGSTTDTDGMVGIVVGTTSTNAQVAFGGQASCTFENATTAGDFVTIGTGTAGDCRDAGTSRSTTAQTIGRVLSSVALGSAAPVALALNGAAAGALANLSDVTLTSPASGNLLAYNGSKWVNETVSAAVTAATAPSFSVNNGTSTQTISTNTWTKMTFGTVSFDTINGWSASNNRYTPTVAGYYIFTGDVYCGGGVCISSVYKDGVIVGAGSETNASSWLSTTSVVLYMNGTSDYVELWGYSSTSTVGTAGYVQYFDGALLAPLASGSVAGTGTANYIPMWSSSSNLTNSILYESSSDIGIGTTVATQPLTVAGNADLTSGSGYLTEITNSTATVAHLAKLNTSGAAIIGSTTDTDGMVGIVVGTTTAGNAQIAVNGQASCTFENATTAGDFVTIGTGTAGDCRDAGTSRSTTAQTIGRVLSSVSLGSTAPVALALNGAGGGAASGSTGYVQFNNGGAFLGTSNLFWNNTAGALGIGTASPNASAILDLTSTTQGLLPPRVTASQMTSISSPAAGLTVYNSTLGAIDVYNGSTWMAGGGGGQLIGVYSCSTAGSNYTVSFTNTSMPTSTGTCGNINLPSTTSYIVVEMWGSGGGGGGGGASSAGNGTAGNSSCFGTNSTACTGPLASATGGGAGAGTGGSFGASGGAGGSGSGGNVNLSGSSGSNGFSSSSYCCQNAAVGGSAPLGGGGSNSSGGAYGGGGVGGSSNGAGAAGGGGGGGGYSALFVNSPSGIYYYTIGAGPSGGSAGTNGNVGGAGGAGGIKISVYTSGVTNGSIGSGTANGLAYYSASGTSLSSIASTANAILATNASGVPAFTTAETVYGTNVGIGTVTPSQPLTIYGNVDASSGSGYLTEITNSTATVAHLAKLNTSGAAVIGSTTDTDGMVGIVVGTTSTNAQVAFGGQASCTFENATTAGDFVTIGTGTAGDCRDAGTTRSSTAQTIGRVLSSVALGSAAPVALALNGAAAGALANLSDVTLTTPANTNILQYNGTKWVNAALSSVTSGITGGIAPSFNVNRNGTNQTVTNAAWTKIQFNNKVFDTNNNFDATTNYRYTPTIAGKYLITLNAFCTDSASCYASVFKNGSEVEQNGGSNYYGNVTVVVDMNGTTDYIEGDVWDNSGTVLGGTVIYTSMYGSLLAPLASGSVAGTGTANYIPMWSSSSNLTNSILYESTSDIGIGTTVATQPLTVAGNADLTSGSGYLTEITNSTATVAHLAKLNTSGAAIIGTTGDTDGMVGIVVGTTAAGNAQVAVNGQASCTFENATTAGDFVTIGTGTAGDCRDAGTSRSTTAQTIGRVLSSVSLGSTAPVALALNGAGGGAASGSTGYVQFNNGGAFLGTSNLFWNNTAGALGIGTASPNASAILDLTSTTQGLLPPRVTSTQMSAISSPAAGLTVYNSTLGAIDVYNGTTWMAGGGGGQLIGVYSCSTAGSNYTVTFTNTTMPTSTGTCGNINLPSTTSYIVVEEWGGGGGGGGGGNGNGTGGAGGNGTSSCFGSNATACTSALLTAGYGAAGTGGANGTTGGAGGTASGGSINLAGNGGSEGAISSGSGGGGAGGNAPRGGGGGPGLYSTGGAGTVYGGGGGGGGDTAASVSDYGGGGGGGGGYAETLIAPIVSPYYYTVGSGGSAGAAGSGGYAGGAGGAGGITISVYTTGVTNGSIGSGAANGLAYYSASGTSLSSIASTANAILATNASGVPAFTTAETVYGTNVGIGTVTPSQPLTIYGNVDASSGSGYLTEITNSTATAGHLAKLNTSGAAVIGSTTDTDGMVGIVVGTTAAGNAQIAVNGQASCTFENATTAGDFVTIGTGTAGDCRDAGTTRSTTAQTIGRVLSSVSSGSTAPVAVSLNGLGGGALSGGTVNYDARWLTTTTIGTGAVYDSGTQVGIGTASPNASAILDLTSTTQGLLPPRVTASQMNAISSPAAGLTVYNSTLGAIDVYNGTTWMAGGGGGQLIGVYSCSTSGSNYTVSFTNTTMPTSTGTCGNINLPSTTSYIVVEEWGAGGGGGGSYNGGAGSSGNNSYFCEANSSCGSTANATFYATGGGGGAAAGGQAGAAGSGGGGDVNLPGGLGSPIIAPYSSFYAMGGSGGSAPLGGGGGLGGGPANSPAASTGNAYGGGGGGGGNNGTTGNYWNGGGGSAGGYVSKFINNPAGACSSGVCYYTVGSGGTYGAAGSSGYAGAAGGPGGIKISVYTTGVTNGSIGSGTANGLAYYSASGTSLSSIASTANAILATNASGVPAFTTAETVYGTNVGIGTVTPSQPLTIYGNVDASSGSGYLTEITNSTATAGHLAKLNTSGAAVIGSTTDTDGMVGIVVGTTSTNAQVAFGGQASCTFENATTAGDFVTIGTGTAGDCRDAGTTRSTTAQTIGRVLSSVSLGSTAPVALALNGAGGGVPAGTTGQLQYNSGSSTFAASANLFWSSANSALGVGTSTIGVAGGTSTLNVYGGASIGTSYTTIAAPTNGLIVAGSTSIGTSSPTNTLTVNGTAGYQFGTSYATTGTQSDVAINTASSVRYTGSAVATFNGIVAGQNGQFLYLNNDSTYALTLANLADSTAANQIITGTGGNLTVAANTGVVLQYDASATNSSGATGAWRVMGGSNAGSSGTGGTAWVMIASTDITTAATSYTFSGLSGDTDGEYQIVARFVGGSSSNYSYSLLPNGDTTAADYGYQALFGTGSTASASQVTSNAGIPFGATAALGQLDFATGTLYAKSGQTRTAIMAYGQQISGTTSTYSALIAGSWNNTASPITSLEILAGATSGLGVGTHLELWAKRSVGGTATPGGSNTQVQYNNNGVLAGDSGFVYGSGAATLGTSLTSPVHYGGTAAGSTLTLDGTSNGSPSSAYVLLNPAGQGNVGIGTVTPSQPLTIYGNVDASSGSGYLTEITNSTATVAHLAKLNTSGAAVIGTTGDTDGMVGIVVGTTAAGNAQIAVNGQASCTFENATTAGDFVTIGTGTAGDCHDAGTSRSATAQTIGRVLSSVSIGSTAAVALGLNGTGGGGVPAGTTGQVQFNSGSSSFAASANLYWDNTNYRLGIGTNGPVAALQVAGSTAVFGSGEGGTPSAVTIRGANAGSSNTAGSSVTIQAGNGTGSAGSGSINFQTAPGAGSTSVTFGSGTSITVSNSPTATISFTVSSNANRLMVVDTATTGSGVSGVTYAGTAMTLLRTNTYNGLIHATYYLVAPSTGTNNVVVTFAGYVNGAVGVASFYNVNQATPIGTPVTSDTSGSTSDALTVSSSAGSLVFESMALSNSDCVTYGGSETSAYSCVVNGSAIGASYATGASSVTVTESYPSTAIDHIAYSIAAGGSTGPDTLTTSMSIANTGFVGIGTTAPGVMLDVNGGTRPGSSATVTSCGSGAANGEGTQRYNYTTHKMEFCDGTSWVALGAATGTIAFFTTSTCPTGWTLYTALQGRYVLGVQSGGTLTGTAGTALSNEENRASGALTFTGNSLTPSGTVSAPNLTINGASVYSAATGGSGANNVNNSSGASTGGIQWLVSQPTFTGNAVTPSGTVTGASAVAGTPAPYIQLTPCQETD